ncbi:MAG: dihydroorotase [Candidatus Omnitrophica bacterium]|nr:dihydroorotase [Candidatus Omnitrophota bacterium]MDD5738227.1 dihydroorotase [Candidatus Omnitrophota bacterium]
MDILLKGGRVVDPASGTDTTADILIKGGKIAQAGREIKAAGARQVDCKGRIVLPGLIDVHTHFRQPGREDEETFVTGSRAALKGGFTSVLCMANTNPVIDNKGLVEYVYAEADKAGLINIYTAAAVTKGLEGKELTEIGQMAAAGARALSDDGKPVMNAEILRRAMEYAKMFGLPVISHCEDANLSKNGVMNEGALSTRLGLKGIPRASETVMAIRDVEIAQLTGAKLHIAHVSAKESIEALRQAKKRKVKVTCETCPHYFTLTEEAVLGYNTGAKVNPPLRTKEDVEAVKEGLSDGTIDIISTDHAPHSAEEKDVEFDFASTGMIGLEFAVSLVNSELVKGGVLGWKEVAQKMSVNPAALLGLKGKGSLSEGSDADVTVFDPGAEWTVEAARIESKSKNTPLIGKKLSGLAVITIVGGKIRYENGKFA